MIGGDAGRENILRARENFRANCTGGGAKKLLADVVVIGSNGGGRASEHEAAVENADKKRRTTHRQKKYTYDKTWDACGVCYYTYRVVYTYNITRPRDIIFINTNIMFYRGGCYLYRFRRCFRGPGRGAPDATCY